MRWRQGREYAGEVERIVPRAAVELIMARAANDGPVVPRAAVIDKRSTVSQVDEHIVARFAVKGKTRFAASTAVDNERISAGVTEPFTPPKPPTRTAMGCALGWATRPA